jgi:hypothetical protein
VSAAQAHFDKSVAWDYLVKQVAFGPRKPGTEAHVACRDYLLSKVKESCDNARLQPFEHTWSTNNQTIKMWNVIGEQNWKDAKVRVALFAHWDTRPTADQEATAENRAKPIPGANDGASGVAVLLELMRAMKAAPAGVGIQYVLVDGEDLGPGLDEMFLGASAYAKALPSPKPDYGILLDMIGDSDLRVPVDPLSFSRAPSLIRALYQHAATIGLASTFPNEYGPEIEDDHVPLNEAGLPTIDLIDFTYKPWHTLADTPDKCSAESLGKVGKLLESWLHKTPPFQIASTR